MSGSLIRSFIIFISSTLVICLLLGLTLMFSRSITLDSVRAIDLKMVYNAIDGLDYKHIEDSNRLKNIFNTFVSPSGYVLFPLAILTPDECIENSDTPIICNKFPRSSSFNLEKKHGKITKYYDVQILKTQSNKYYYFKRLGLDNIWLIGESGQYAGNQGAFHQELIFLKEAPKYLTTSYGFRKMAEKSIWTWIICFFLGVVIWVLYLIWISRAEHRFMELKKASHVINKKLVENQTHVYKLRNDRDELLQKFENMVSNNQDKIIALKEELESAEALLDEEEEEKQKLISQQQFLQDQLSKAQKHLSKLDRTKETESLERQLFELKKLWLTDPDWLERGRIEKSVASSDLGREPFTDYIAFVHMEYYLKKACEFKKIYDVDGNVDRINALWSNRLISEKEKNMLHSARKARNDWFHEATPPSRELMQRLRKFLNTRKHPDIRPQI